MKKAKDKQGKSVAKGVIDQEYAADGPQAASKPARERIPADSLAARSSLERGALLKELRHSIVQMAVYHEEHHGASTEEAIAYAVDPRPWESTEDLLNRIEKISLESLAWSDLASLFCRDEMRAEQVWGLLKQEARREFLTGHRVASVSETAEWQREPWKRARFLAIRDGFVNQWQPTGAIELAMIDTMAQAYSEYLYWSEETHRRSTTDMKLSQELDEARYYKGAEGNWVPPRVSEQNAVEHAMQMADRFNRLFLRTLRQLRDLRRYSAPITINNPGQVNIAADGGKQINVAEAEKRDDGPNDA